MSLFLITTGVFAFAILIMAIGVMAGGRRIKGSCGGPGGCELCFLKDGRKRDCHLPCERAGPQRAEIREKD